MTNSSALAWDLMWEAAKCRGVDPELFFLPDDRVSKVERTRREFKAKAVCRQCPIRTQCLKYALDHRITVGVWGGHSERDLAQLLLFRKDRPKQADTQLRKSRQSLA